MGYLRLALAISVLFYHAGNFFGYTGINGLIAVHIFFIISGFYMTLVLLTKYSKAKNPYFTFLSNRFLRIYPIYWIILILTIYIDYSQFSNFRIESFIINIPSSFNQYITHHKLIAIASDFSLLIRTDYHNIDMFRYNGFGLVGPSWSLVIELLFYIVAPILVIVKKRYLFFLMFSSVTIYYLILRYHYLINDYYIQTFFIPANLFFFILGIYSYHFYSWLKRFKTKNKYMYLPSFIFLSFILLWQFLPLIYFRHILLNEWISYFATPIFLPFLFISLNAFPLSNVMADLSYPVYISHILAIDFLQNSLKFRLGSQYFALDVLIVTCILSLILVYCIEKPIDKWRQKRVKRSILLP